MSKEKTKNNQNYQHGGSPLKDFDRLGIAPRPVTDFSVNINPLGPPREVIGAWQGLHRALLRYPSVDGDGVRRFYEKRFDLPSGCVLPGNGSIELIYLAPRVLGFKKVLILTPCFHDYARAAELVGAEVVSIPMDRENGFSPVPLAALETMLCDVDAFCIGNPNNPTGTVINREDLLYLADKYSDKWVLVDEAFVQFLEDGDKRTLMNRRFIRPNLIVFHSLTKFYALPGLRLGGAIGHGETISRLAAMKEPWTVNGVAEKTAHIIADCLDYEVQTKTIIGAERQRMTARLRTMTGIKILPPTANFFLAQWTDTGDLDDLLRHLLSRGLYIRDCRNFAGLEDNYFRFGIRTPEEDDRLLAAMAGFQGDGHG